MGILILVAWLVTVGLLLGVKYRKALIALWREPVFSAPILIVESDDWGAGPKWQGEALRALQETLSRFTDKTGRHPVMTLGLVLAINDANRMRDSVPMQYHRHLLSAPEFGPILDSIEKGIGIGVFSPQLHGMEHYWPPSLLAYSQSDPDVRQWLAGHDMPSTEALPSHLQSRWIDASGLPSHPLCDMDIQAAVAEEIRVFETIFGKRPEVVVPPTFVWNAATERAWSAGGVCVIVTPGTRYEARDRHGKLVPGKGKILNGQAGENGIVYLVRDDYFEPALGHRAEGVISAMTRKCTLGRPTLLETHRFNFTGEPAAVGKALQELDRMLALVLQQFPAVRFMSTAELARYCMSSPVELRETRNLPRIRIWLLRVREIPRFWKLARITGAALPFWLLSLLVYLAPQPRPPH